MTARAGLALVLVLVALSACTTVIPNVPESELHKSEQQTLILKNSFDYPLLVQAQTGDGEPLTVAGGGGSVKIMFEVRSMIRKSMPEGSPRNVVEATNPPGYLVQSDASNDAILRIGSTGAQADKRRFSLNDYYCPKGGWGKEPAPAHEHTIDIAHLPSDGRLMKICPHSNASDGKVPDGCQQDR